MTKDRNPSTRRIPVIKQVLKIQSTELSIVAMSTETLDKALWKKDSKAIKSTLIVCFPFPPIAVDFEHLSLPLC